MSKKLSVIDALDKELRDHEMPSEIQGTIVVTANFAYLVDDLQAELSGCQQPAILLHTSDIAEQLDGKVPESMGGLALYIEPCTIKGILMPSGVGLFERCLYRINQLVVKPQGEPEVVLTDLLFN